LLGAGIFWIAPGRALEVRTVTARERAEEAGGATVLNASGYVTARRRATVASKITGRLVEVHVEEGLPVSRGQVLARLDDSQDRAALALAESRLEAARRAIAETRAQIALARTTLERTRRLVEGGVTNREQLDQDETDLATLEARLAVEEQGVVVADRELSLQRAQLDDTVVRAPFDGIVVSKDAQPGEMVSPNSAGGGFTRTGICTIVDMSSLEIEVDVNEAYISRVRPGQRVEAVLDAYPDWRIPAHVITTIPTADRQKATVLVRIGFEALDPRLLPDMGVKVALREEAEAGAKPRAAVVVPSAAVHRDGSRDVVWVVHGERVERRAVSIGRVAEAEATIVSGLSGGEQVVLDGPENLKEGARVSVLPSEEGGR